MNLKAVGRLFQETFKEWNQDKASRLAAALSYYAIFSIAPLLIIVIAVVGFVYGEDAATGVIEEKLQGLVGLSAAKLIQSAIQNANKPHQGTIASIISIVVLLFGATGLFTVLQDALNTIWGVQPKPGSSVKNLVRQRVLSFAMVLSIGFLLLISLVISTILNTIVKYFGHLIPGADLLWDIVNYILSFSVTAVLFGLIFKVLPDVKIAWSDVSIGAILTAILFSIGKFLLEKYLVSSSFGSAYGAAGSIIVVLAWVNYAAQILFFGAEFTKVYAKKYGSRIIPSKNAMPIGDTGNQVLMKLNRSNSWISRLRRRFTRAKRPKRR